MKSKLSIITINKDNAVGLEKTIESVVSQNFKGYRYIVIDGDSKDGSIEIIRKYQDRINFWVSEPDKGIYNAMNKGIANAKGEYCLFINSGDYLVNENALLSLFNYEFTEDVVYANQQRIGSKGEYVIKYPEKLTFFHFYAEYLGHNSTLIKRKLFSDIGFYNETNQIVSDWEFLMLAVCKYNCSWRHVPVIFSAQQDGGISNSISHREKVQAERRKALEEHFPLFIEDYEKMFNLTYNTPFKRMKRRIKKLIYR
jgi:glycosyltransferase involved in cell wall biosynthesis